MTESLQNILPNHSLMMHSLREKSFFVHQKLRL